MIILKPFRRSSHQSNSGVSFSSILGDWQAIHDYFDPMFHYFWILLTIGFLESMETDILKNLIADNVYLGQFMYVMRLRLEKKNYFCPGVKK